MKHPPSDNFSLLLRLIEEERGLYLRLSEVKELARGVRVDLVKASGKQVAQPAFGGHRCDASPTRECVYDETEDPECDFCLYCGDPEERT